MTEQWPDERWPDEQRPDPRPEDRDDLTQTIAFQPIDPYSLGNRDDDEGGAPAGPGFRPGRPGLRQRAAGLGPVKLGLTTTAVVLIVVGAAWGTATALSSPADDPAPAAAAGGPTATATHAPGHARKAGAKAARITVTTVAAGSFTGTEARGTKVTVVFGDDTRFGTKARPLSAQDIKPGDVVNVLGDLSGDTLTATDIVLPLKRNQPPSGDGTATPGPAAGDPTADPTG